MNVCDKCGHPIPEYNDTCPDCRAKPPLSPASGSTAPTRRIEIEIEWQHEDTGVRFTKRIPEGEAIPAFPRRNIIAWRVL